MKDDILIMTENISDKSNHYRMDNQNKNNEIKSIVLGLFALIGFIITVYSIFTVIVGEPLTSIANSVFVAVIIGSVTLIGPLIGGILLKNKTLS